MFGFLGFLYIVVESFEEVQVGVYGNVYKFFWGDRILVMDQGDRVIVRRVLVGRFGVVVNFRKVKMIKLN